jgi:hypothetical protein
MIPSIFSRDLVIGSISFIFVLGSLTIAVIDPNYRQPFMDLSKIFLGGLVGLMIPSDRVMFRRRIH